MRLRNSMCVMLGAFALNACASIHLGPENETDVRVVDLKISGGPIGWLDNETIVIIAESGERYARKDGAMQPITRVMTINYKTNEKQTYGKVSGEFCFSEGYVSYAFLDRATDELWVSYGELGKEATQKVKPGEINFDRGPRGSCRPWSERPKSPPWVKEKTAIWPLSPYLGLINCNVPAATLRTQYIKARFHRPDDQVGVELPFSCYEVSSSLKYYPFKNAYFGLEFDFRSPWPMGRDRRVFWLYTDGRVETLVLPYSEAIREAAIPTARGIIGFSRPSDREGDYWIYLVTPEATKRVLRGHAAGITSPDGCKVAMAHDPDFKARIQGRKIATKGTLKVLEVCGSE